MTDRLTRSTDLDNRDDSEMPIFSYVDAAGKTIITNDLTDVPQSARQNMRIMTSYEVPKRATSPIDALHVPTHVGDVHVASFALGVVCAIVLALLFGLRKSGSRVWRGALIALCVILAGGVYFGWVLKQAGLVQDLSVSSPGAFLDHASAAAAARKQQAAQAQEQLREIARDLQ